jgi:hypothetical protein
MFRVQQGKTCNLGFKVAHYRSPALFEVTQRPPAAREVIPGEFEELRAGKALQAPHLTQDNSHFKERWRTGIALYSKQNSPRTTPATPRSQRAAI